MISHREAALTYLDRGYSVIPILANGTKKPQLKWEKYQTALPTVLEVTKWWRTSPESGVGIICGAVSGNVEMLELEARANTAEALDKITDKMISYGVEDFWINLTESGYVAATPSGGLHLMYRITDHPVPGNTKIARRPATADELAENPRDKIKVLSETRGEGGYFVAAPTGGAVHKTGDSWSLLAGKIGDKIWEISWTTRCLIHDAIRDALDEMPAPVAPAPSAPAVQRDGTEPGTDYNNREQWRSLLESYGWTYESSRGIEQFWTRPGKDRRDGASATLYYQGSDNLYVFSSSTELPVETPISKFAFYTFMEHNGDFSAAARALSRAGYGTRSEVDISDWFVDEAPSRGARMGGVVESPTAAVEEAVLVQAPKMNRLREWSETGMAHLVVNHVGDNFRAVAEEQGWRVYRSGRWVADKRSVVHAAVEKVTEIPRQQALDALEAAEANGDKDEIRSANKLLSAVTSFRSARGINAITTRFAQQRGIAVEAGDFDAQRNLICLNNGTFDLDTMKLREHRPTDMLTKKINISYDETATCSGFLKFLEECVPDPEYRDFLRRALGMTLLGRIREAAFLVLHGPTGCGKSQFVKIAQALLGEYAATAASGTFRESKIKGTNDSYDLHDLRGVRMASMSETSEGDVLNEELIKRITGGDTVKTRALYQSHIEWKPDFTVWVATNFRPNLNVSDDAIWRRVKTVEFPNQFKGDKAEIGIAERLIDTELAGIFNWLLEGVQDYVSVGLKEPSTMAESLEAYRDEINPVNQFLTESLAEGVLIAEEGAEISSSELYGRFASWNEANGIRRFWGQKRFGQEIEKKGYIAHKGTRGVRMRKGLKLREGQWLAGYQRTNWT